MKRTLSLLLLGAILLSAAACGSEAPADTTAGSESVDTTVPEETTPAVILPDVEKSDYKDAPFHILAPDHGNYQTLYYTDAENGDVMNDAIYERIRLTEEYLGIDIQYTKQGAITDTYPLVQASVMADDDNYQMVLTHTFRSVSSMATEGLLYDWHELPFVDLDREYWNQSINENLTLYDKLYFAVSDFLLKEANCILFNKDMVKEYKLENPYEIVDSGKWTIEKMYELCEAVTDDVNGDSNYDVNDQYGLVGEADWMLNSFLFSSGIRLTERNDEGGLDLVINNEHTVKLLELLEKAVAHKDFAFMWRYNTAEAETVTMGTGRALFQITGIGKLSDFRDVEIDLGILPYPKLYETQEKYETNSWSGLMCVPATVKNPEMVGKACEMLAYFSGETTIPAYYDLLLGEKLARDEESKAMIEMIFDNIIYDAGMHYFQDGGVKNLFYTIPYMLVKKQAADFASYYASNGPQAEADIEAFLTSLKEDK